MKPSYNTLTAAVLTRAWARGVVNRRGELPGEEDIDKYLKHTLTTYPTVDKKYVFRSVREIKL